MSVSKNTTHNENLVLCEICESEKISELWPVEMMHGLEGPFKYVHCENCGTTYQPEKLDDYGKYYPKSYYSFQYKEPDSLPKKFRQFKRRLRNKFYYFEKNFFGRLLARVKPCPINHLSQHVRLHQNMSILEIGSGTGELLHELADIGIRRVIGIDPFIQKDIRYSNGAMVLRASIDDLTQYFSNETFDLIMFNHSIEHSTTPIFDLAKVSSFLKQNGEILVRLPVSNSEIARYYGKYWWSLDAPRHIYIFSISSMKMVAMKCGLTVKRIHFEGTIDDFLASEQHKAGIALLSENSYVISKKFSNFNKNQLAQYKKEIEKQNKLGTAALAGFVLGLKN